MTTTVQAALSAVMAELPAIGKTGKASPQQGGYSYRGIEDITSVLQPLLAKHGVVIAPRARLLWMNPALGMKDNWTNVALEVEWLITGPDGSSITAQTVGIGQDGSDKGANKAMSQATKYLYLELFCISDHDDDSDGADNTAGVAPQRTTQARRPSAPPADKTPSQHLFDALTKQTPEMQKHLRAVAQQHQRKLSVVEFDTDPAWFALVQEIVTDGDAKIFNQQTNKG